MRHSGQNRHFQVQSSNNYLIWVHLGKCHGTLSVKLTPQCVKPAKTSQTNLKSSNLMTANLPEARKKTKLASETQKWQRC